MEKKYIYYPFMVLAMTVALSSCDDFLDEMPDNRTELDTEAKITSMLVSAYPETNYALLAEMSSDNADDNGGTWTAYNKLQEVRDGSIRFDHVTFKYKHGSGQPVLNDITFDIKPGYGKPVIFGSSEGRSIVMPCLQPLCSGQYF